MAIPIWEWKWFGMPGHFIGASSCVFHMCTQVGNYLVSTVGDYRPQGGDGAAREIGHNRLFETMVFDAGTPCTTVDCGCGAPTTNGRDIDFASYNTAGSANVGHMEMCRKWALRVLP